MRVGLAKSRKISEIFPSQTPVNRIFLLLSQENLAFGSHVKVREPKNQFFK
jgi:hypothetical protein